MVRATTVLLLACLCLPLVARAHRDPASDYLLGQDVFRPLKKVIGVSALERLSAAVRGAERAGFPIKVALIAEPSDLGAELDLYRKPQRYAEHLGLELASAYRGPVLIVMPNGFGYAVGGEPSGHARALSALADPGSDPTKQAEAATLAVRRLAANAGHPIALSTAGSDTRDRITIAAAATAGIALIAGFVLFRRDRRRRSS